jgi:hypothetical protein
MDYALSFIRKPRFRGLKCCAQGHTAESQDPAQVINPKAFTAPALQLFQRLVPFTKVVEVDRGPPKPPLPAPLSLSHCIPSQISSISEWLPRMVFFLCSVSQDTASILRCTVGLMMIFREKIQRKSTLMQCALNSAILPHWTMSEENFGSGSVRNASIANSKEKVHRQVYAPLFL